MSGLTRRELQADLLQDLTLPDHQIDIFYFD